MQRFRSIRFRLTAWYTLALLVLLTLAFLFIYFVARAQLYDTFDRDLVAHVQATVGSPNHESDDNHAPPAGQSFGGPPIGDNAGQPPHHNDVYDMAVGEVVVQYDSAGKLLNQINGQLSTTQTAELYAGIPDNNIHSIGLDDNSTYRGLRLSNRPDGTVTIVARPTTPIDEPLGNMLSAFALSAPLALLLAALGGLFLTSRALLPVAIMNQRVQEISSHDLSRRLALGPPRDELTGLASTIDAMLARIETGVEQQRRFTADASHELRTPLTVISSEAEFALSRNRPAADYRSALATIQREGETMQRLTEDLLTLARSDAGQLPAKTQVDMVDLATNAVARLSNKASAADVTLTLTDMDISAPVCGNEDQLARIIINLIDNAIKYSPPHSQVRVALSSLNNPPSDEITSRAVPPHGPLVAVSVSDCGPGISSEHLPHLFERFYRADTARTRSEQSGTGLGLAICAALAHDYGGWIGVRSAPGHGSRFTLYLPRLDSSKLSSSQG